jgi:HK97 family phage major capsid protein
MAWKEDDGFINGNGGSGEPVGLLNTPGVISITKETGQAADTIVFQNVIKADARVFDMTNRDSLFWIANRTCKVQLSQMTLDVGTAGVPVFLPADGAKGRPWESLYGFPAVFSEHAPVLGDAGDLTLVNGKEYLVGSAQGKTRTDRDMGLKFDYDQVAFRVVTYSGGCLPWRAALTPQNGDTLHPVIKIAERA